MVPPSELRTLTTADKAWIIDAVCINCNKRFKSMQAISMHLRTTATRHTVNFINYGEYDRRTGMREMNRLEILQDQTLQWESMSYSDSISICLLVLFKSKNYLHHPFYATTDLFNKGRRVKSLVGSTITIIDPHSWRICQHKFSSCWKVISFRI